MPKAEWNPGRLLELSGGYWSACVVHAGVRLDLFTVLGDRPLGQDALVQATGCEQRGLSMLLNALTALDLLTLTDGTYRATSFAQAFLSKESPRYLGHIILHHHHLMESWAHLDQAVRSGQPLRSQSVFAEEEWRENFLLGMFNLGMNLAPQLVRQLDLGGRRRLLDLGGGPGTYAIHFCLQNPGLRAVVYDLPTTRPFAEQTIGRFGLTDRIEFQDGNFLEQGINGRFDVAWLSHILHGEGPAGCRRIIQRAVAALEPGGLIFVQEFILQNDLAGPLFPALFSLNMLVATDQGQAYSEAQLMAMLAEAGVHSLRRVQHDLPGHTGLIVGSI